jgi:hypothetical protein
LYEVYCFSRKLEKIVKPFKFSSLIRVEHDKENFIRHGLRVITLGNKLISNQIATYMNLSFHQKEVLPISMEWKNANDDSILDVNKIMQDFSSISITDSDDVD